MLHSLVHEFYRYFIQYANVIRRIIRYFNIIHKLLNLYACNIYNSLLKFAIKLKKTKKRKINFSIIHILIRNIKEFVCFSRGYPIDRFHGKFARM